MLRTAENTQEDRRSRRLAFPWTASVARRFALPAIGWLVLTSPHPMQSLHAQEPAPGNAIVLEVKGTVEVMHSDSHTWNSVSLEPEKNLLLHPGDQLRTQPHSRALVRLADRTVMPIGSESHLRVLEPLPSEVSFIEVLKGWFYFLHRDKPGRIRLRTGAVTAAIRGTEFSLQVAAADGATRLDLFDGQVTLTNAAGQLALTSGQAAVTGPGTAPAPTALLEAVNVIQWNLYYPAVLNVEDLALPDTTRARLHDSLLAYQRGNLWQALARHPETRSPESGDEMVYRAALALSVGNVDEAVTGLSALPDRLPDNRTGRLADALRLLVAAVKFQARPATLHSQPSTSTEWLAESYYQQSRSDLQAARHAARQAVARAPDFAFALARLAELEFGFGRVKPAEEALARGVVLAPENAQAVALQGFVLAARNHVPQAIATFERAIALDPGLGNAWLGRGLCRIRRGRVADGLDDLLVAAATEPQRAVLRSYLGKAFTGKGELDLARHELELARGLDPNDPTAWLYSALLNQLDLQINRAIRDLERSQTLNANRSVFRSRELLDQDRAVRGVNLANVYADAGLTDVAYREAARAVYDDYANFSTHLFLANSFNRLRDPRQANLRYETPWLSEYLVANLLAPVGGGTLSQLVSTEEYSRLFEQNRLGLVSATEYASNGDWLQAGSQYGRWGNASYALEETYRSQRGFRPNGDLERLTLSAQSKVQLGPQDDLFLQAIYSEAEGGDLAPHYSAAEVNRGLRFEETQEPILVAGYHRAWAPGSHTLFLAARLDDTLTLTNPAQSVVDLGVDTRGRITDAGRAPLRLDYRSELELYTAELQHILQWGDHTSIVGARYQTGEFATRNVMPRSILIPATSDAFETEFERISAYGYHHWQLLTPLRLIAGVSYDRVGFPENFRSPPVSGGHASEDQVSPKAGLIWTPWADTVVRAAYTHSLGGVSIDQSFQLEPAQVAGFVQTYRSVIPESVAGPASAARHRIWGLALDQKFPTHTYLGISGDGIESESTHQVGVFRIPFPQPAFRSSTPENLSYRERTLSLSLNQLLGEEWSLGCLYRLSHAELEDTFTEVPVGTPSFGGFVRREDLEATLHQLHLLAAWNSPRGWFAGFDSVFSSQRNSGSPSAQPGDDFWQFNLVAGYRFPRRRAELSVGLLNLTDQDYRLNPLNLTSELPRERTVAVRLRWAF